ncbi:MAG: (2Fe-2S)-binding protein [Bdellovibrionaceae bacterium]|nr:(2Fe-2S)-binding protein [Pseudobdellovibrionaceae bacterium]
MSSLEDTTKITVELEGRDRIEVVGEKVRFRGCTELTQLMIQMKKDHGPQIRQWPAPEGDSHSELLLREMVLKLANQWSYPYKEAEVCHCRNVSCKAIDQAIVAGAHTTAVVSRQTSASTACGTCRPDVQQMINYRLQSSAVVTPQKKSA